MTGRLRMLSAACVLGFGWHAAGASEVKDPQAFETAPQFGEWAPVPTAAYLQWLVSEQQLARDAAEAARVSSPDPVEQIPAAAVTADLSARSATDESVRTVGWTPRIAPEPISPAFPHEATEPTGQEAVPAQWRARAALPTGRVRLNDLSEEETFHPPRDREVEDMAGDFAAQTELLAPTMLNGIDAVAAQALAPQSLDPEIESVASVTPIPVSFPASPSGSWQLVSQEQLAFKAVGDSPLADLAPADLSGIEQREQVVNLLAQLEPPAQIEERLYAPGLRPMESLPETPVDPTEPEGGEQPSPAAAELFKPVTAIGLTRGMGAPRPENLAIDAMPMLSPVCLWSTGWACTTPNRYTMCFCHRPLYFEEANLERCGLHFGCCQPLVSATHFFGGVALLPLKMTVHCPDELLHTLGDCPTCHSFGWEACLR